MTDNVERLAELLRECEAIEQHRICSYEAVARWLDEHDVYIAPSISNPWPPSDEAYLYWDAHYHGIEAERQRCLAIVRRQFDLWISHPLTLEDEVVPLQMRCERFISEIEGGGNPAICNTVPEQQSSVSRVSRAGPSPNPEGGGEPVAPPVAPAEGKDSNLAGEPSPSSPNNETQLDEADDDT